MESTARTSALESMAENKTMLLWAGVISSLAGLVALSFPIVTSLSISLLMGVALVLAGISSVASSFSLKVACGFWPVFLSGVAAALLGVLVLMDPLSGLVALTLWIAAGLFVNGAFEVFVGFKLRPEGSWLVVVISGIVGIVFSGLIAFNLVASSMVLVGTMVGVSFIVRGAAYLSLWMAVPQSAATGSAQFSNPA